MNPAAGWIDTHCHLDAFEFSDDAHAVWQHAVAQGVRHCVIPAVEAGNFEAVRTLAHATGNSYCLGIHPLYVPQASEQDLQTLHDQLALHQHDKRLVAVGEIGLDFFVPAMTVPLMREKQEHFYRSQLRLAQRFELPVVLHVRRSADRLLKFLRAMASPLRPWRGIAHAFNGSEVQARAFTGLGFKLGFGGAMTFERALQLRHLARTLPTDALVLETDAPDIAPRWLYTVAAQRALGVAQGRNTPGELPRIAAELAQLRSLDIAALERSTTHNACAALPKLASLLV